MPFSTRIRKIFVFSAFFLLLALQELRAGTVADTVDCRNLRADVEFLSDSLCRGRATGDKGCFEAYRYVLRRLQQTGLKVWTYANAAGRNTAHSIVAERKAGKGGWTVVCAHYDGIGLIGGTFHPCADNNASGVAAMLALAEAASVQQAPLQNIVFAALDGHNSEQSGARELKKLLSGRRIDRVICLEIIGSRLAPPHRYLPEYLICLGAQPWKKSLEKYSYGLHLSFDYYDNRDFTDLFYRKLSDAAPFIDAGIPSVVFTSGITDLTNNAGDTAQTLDYGLMNKRVNLIWKFINNR